MKVVSYCKTSIILVVCSNMCANTQQQFLSTERQNDPKKFDSTKTFIVFYYISLIFIISRVCIICDCIHV